ncbi:BZ3500_MvSof-1268-A1-R1_Chr11-2g03358 [Microbotryum saponariae]|uniref:BZ3500_MvSof-1268-A1-R1_Chr11-2g03358 protein n=1 Tax=Microbotryum saponariae TaxID=289078 RepID=A0A2X0NDV7_9BASI|nr:BZ3500_MvSof-1268-A1-R1_Chr11-2g03358 [Microbotryum saponariae]SDA03197.1 BZ3501_MvSof-1269-A2-R1_Chr11g02929 [Microbotryum saponariae]
MVESAGDGRLLSGHDDRAAKAPLDAGRDKFKDRGTIIAARKQDYRSIAIAGLPFSVQRIWRHIDYAERMQSG